MKRAILGACTAMAEARGELGLNGALSRRAWFLGQTTVYWACDASVADPGSDCERGRGPRPAHTRAPHRVLW